MQQTNNTAPETETGKPALVYAGLRMPESLNWSLRALAVQRKTSFPRLVISALEAFVARENGEAA